MSSEQSPTVWWFRRPRKPLSGVLDNGLLWCLAFFWLAVAFLVGLGVVVSEEGWWAKVGGSVTSLAGLGTAVFLIGYLLRPAHGTDDRAGESVDSTAIDSWAEALDRVAHVDVSLSKRSLARASAQVAFMLLVAGFFMVGLMGGLGIAFGIVIFLMAVFLGLLPHLEQATAGRPALRIDSRGVEIARWTGLEIPWSEVLAVRAHPTTRTQRNLVVDVTPAFYEQYQATRPFPLRISDSVHTWLFRPGFSIPATIAADAESLAAWLDSEASRRNPENAWKDQANEG